DRYRCRDNEISVEYLNLNDQALRVRCLDQESSVQILQALAPSLSLQIDSVVHKARVAWAGTACALHFEQADYTLNKVPRFLDARQHAAANIGCIAPMPGKVVKIYVAEGDAVQRGQELIVIEAMKMEQTLIANQAGKASRICVTVGQQVQAHE